MSAVYRFTYTASPVMAVLLTFAVMMLLSGSGSVCHGFTTGTAPSLHKPASSSATATGSPRIGTARYAQSPRHDDDDSSDSLHPFQKTLQSTLTALVLATSITCTSFLAPTPPPALATDSVKIATCLFQKCQLSLAKCVGNPKCLANVICINTCNNRPDESECQVECGNLWENDVVGEFNKCAVSDMDCVPQRADDGSYPIPDDSKLVKSFPTSLFNGKWYISAGQNELFDIFPCQVHFFTETKPGTFFGKLNWRIEEPDGEFFTRDAIQQFVQDPKQPAHLINHDNEYLHYQDDWYVLDYETDNNPSGTPPFAFIYYRGSNDAWDGYGGAVVYTRDAKLPPSLIPRLRVAAQKVNWDWDKDFFLTDNSCPTAQDTQERLVLRERFAGKVALQTERQVQAAATRFRGNALNGVKAQQLFVKSELEQANAAFSELANREEEFVKEQKEQQQQQQQQPQ